MSATAPFHLARTPLIRGSSLIEASAGTGKTYAITALVVRLIVEWDLSIRQILVVTYTEAATEELRHRIRQMLAEAGRAFASGTSEVPFLQELVQAHQTQSREMELRLQNALSGFDEAPIYTIHGFCQRTLKDRAFESGLLFDTELVTGSSDLLREIADDFWRQRFYETAPVLVQFALKNKLGPETYSQLLQTCVNYPRLEFLSQAKGRRLDAIASELEASFHEARSTWRSARAAIQACFGSNARWGNRPYNSDQEMALLFEELDTCFSKIETAFEALDCLEAFCAAAMEAGKNKKSKSGPPVPKHVFFEQCERICQLEKLWLAGLNLDFVDYARQELPRRKAERKIQFFDDLLTRLDQALSSAAGPELIKGLRGRYQAALIDEFQDTDPIQYQVFRRAFGDKSTFLFMIGDPKQAIYGFRGADIFTYLEAAGEADRHFTLGENWRSESGLVRAVNQVFSLQPRAFVYDRIQFQEAIAKGRAGAEPLRIDGGGTAPFQIWFWERQGSKEITRKLADSNLPGVVAAEIVRLLHSGSRLGHRRLRPEDIAVLVMENRQAAKVQEALNMCRVPNVLYTTASLFESDEAAQLHRVLAGIASPGNEPLVRSALATGLIGVNATQLHALSEDQWQHWLEAFHEYLGLWDEQGFFRMFRYWLQEHDVRARLLALPNGERRLTNLLHLGEALHQAEAERHLGISGLLRWLADQIVRLEEAPEEHQLRLERDENAVRIVTVHKSKGLEYPVVFCPYCWKGSEIKRGSQEQVFFHDPAQALRLVRDLGPEIDEEHRRLAKEEKLAENVRLLYVALTRAKHRCYFVWGAFRGAGSSAGSWLLHRPDSMTGPTVEALDGHFKSLTDAEMRSKLASLERHAGGAIEISDLPEVTPSVLAPLAESAPVLKAREFKGHIRRDWLISSFTHLTAGSHEEAPDRDSLAPRDQEESIGSGIFAFARGAKAGTCLHEILERLDFGAAGEVVARLVRERLQANQLEGPGACEAVCQMLDKLVNFPLDPAEPELRLSRIPMAERLVELEFYFPIRKLVPRELLASLGRCGWADSPKAPLSMDGVNGFLKGYIDLVFRFNGRFYLVDWKSNWLGNSLEDYAQPALRTEMFERQYYLQYHLYTVALDKYLKLRMPQYEYERHLGGVFYLFLRGIDPAQPDCGAFRDRPNAAVIEELAELLEKGAE